MHGAVGIAHGVRIFAEDEGLFPMFLQIGADPVRRSIHFRLDIRDLPQAQGGINGVHLVVALVMHGTGGIQALKLPAHGQDHLSGQAFVAAAPDQDARMVPVPAHHGTDPVQQQRLPIGLRAWEHLVLCDPCSDPLGDLWLCHEEDRRRRLLRWQVQRKGLCRETDGSYLCGCCGTG